MKKSLFILFTLSLSFNSAFSMSSRSPKKNKGELITCIGRSKAPLQENCPRTSKLFNKAKQNMFGSCDRGIENRCKSKKARQVSDAKVSISNRHMGLVPQYCVEEIEVEGKEICLKYESSAPVCTYTASADFECL
jgi:hypothetical protein